MSNKILREILIIALLFLVIMFTLGILFYDYIPTDSGTITSVKYVADENVEHVLNEIQTNSGIDIKSQNTDSPLKSYTIDANDLNIYASEKYYESGKKDPFAEYSEPIEETVRTTKAGITASNTQVSNPIVVVKEEIVQEEVKQEEPVELEVKEENKIEEKEETNLSENASSVLNKVSNKTTTITQNTTVKNESTIGTFFEKEDSK